MIDYYRERHTHAAYAHCVAGMFVTIFIDKIICAVFVFDKLFMFGGSSACAKATNIFAGMKIRLCMYCII